MHFLLLILSRIRLICIIIYNNFINITYYALFSYYYLYSLAHLATTWMICTDRFLIKNNFLINVEIIFTSTTKKFTLITDTKHPRIPLLLVISIRLCICNIINIINYTNNYIFILIQIID